MKLYKIFIPLCLLLALSLTAQAEPQQCPAAKGEGFMSGLSEQQLQKVKDVTGKHHKELFTLQKELSDKQTEQEALLSTVPLESKKIEAVTKEIATLQGKITTLNTQYRMELTEITGKPLHLNSAASCTQRACASTPPHNAAPCAYPAKCQTECPAECPAQN